MGQPWKTYLVVAVIIGLLLGAGVGWLAKPVVEVPVEKTVEKTIEKTIEVPVTKTVEVPVSPVVIKVGVMGKSVHPYWEVVDKGVKAAEKALNEQFAAAGLNIKVEARFWVPFKEDIPAQLKTMETWMAEKLDGIAIAPSDPAAAGPYIETAIKGGIQTITIDTDAPESVRLAYAGTDNYEAGREAGRAMVEILTKLGYLPGKPKVAMATGSLTAANSLERMAGFKEVLEAAGAIVLEPVCDFEDAAKALELASSVIAANPDLVGAFGVYAYNGPAWARAVVEAGKVGEIAIVEFDATKENIEPIKEGVIYATMAQRQYFQGYYAVQLLVLMKLWGTEEALKFFIPGYRYPEKTIYDTGIDVVRLDNLKAYAAELDARGEPYDWTP